MIGVYKVVGGLEGVGVGRGRWEAEGRLQLPLGHR